MSNKDKVLTIRVTIKDPAAAAWIWKAYPEAINGVVVTGLSWGDMFSERDTLADAACFYIREEGEDTEDAIDAHCGEPFSCPDSAAREAPKNVSSGAKWDIVDQRGNVVRSSG